MYVSEYNCNTLFFRVTKILTMHHYSIRFALHHYTRKNKTRQVYLFANINRERPSIAIPLGIFATFQDFDKSKAYIKKSTYENSVIENQKMKAFGIFQTARYLDRPLTGKRFKYLMESQGLQKDFLIFMLEEMKKQAFDYSEGTFKTWNKTYKKILAFKKSIPISDIDLKFIKSFDNWLKNQICTTGTNKGKPISYNTVVSHHKRFSKFITIAIEKLELNIENPYKKFKTTYQEGQREFLEPAEIEKMVKLYDLRDELNLPIHLKESLRMFLFMVGSGFRISDSGRMTGLHINNDIIRIRQEKVKRWKMEETFPMSAFSKKYIDTDEKGRLFKYKNSQSLNKNLKTICKYLNINKNITSHSARHTFATTFLIAGGRIEVLKDLLGHSDIKTTMIYVHITKEVERKQMILLDDFLLF